MNADRLLALYDRVSEAPDAVTRFRRFVLDLAVRGKLVEQDPADEPASELLTRIAVEKLRLMEAGEIKKQKELPPIDPEPFDLPANWQWVRVREVTSDRGQKVPDDNFTYLDVTAINKEAGVVADPKVLGKDDAPSRARKIAAKGDVIYSCVRPYLLNVAVLDEDFDPEPIASTAFAVLNGHGLVLSWYLWIALRSPFMVECVEENQRGQAYPAINDRDFSLLPFPLPPLTEQRRIVARVDELMALLDQLETVRTDREDTRDRLTAASLGGLTAPETDAETFPAHAQFALDTLPVLTTRPDQIKQLRETILSLAVRGKLGTQDPSDDSASNLLARIAKNRTSVLNSDYPNAAEAKKQKRKQEQQSVPAGLPKLPTGWVWATLQQCSLIVVDCKNKTAPYSSGGIKLIRTTNVRDGKLNSNDVKYVTQKTYEAWSLRTKPEPGDILITREAPMGEVCIIPEGEQICLGQRIMLVRLVPQTIDVRYMLYSLRDPDLLERVQDKPIGMTVKHLRVGGVETLLIPLPPLAEQHRIVVKVAELMSLCDQIEKYLEIRESSGQQLLESLLDVALRPAAGEATVA